MNKSSEKADINKKEKWEFEDYAYTLTGIIVGFLLLVPDLLLSLFDISILGGSLGGTGSELAEGLEHGYYQKLWSINELRALSPLLFLATTAICFVKDAVDARKSGGYSGSMFSYTFEDLLEDAIYMVITTILVYSAVLTGIMYMSWLAGPITWILFIFFFPLVRKKTDVYDEVETPYFLLIIFAIGLITELITGLWITFPMAWLIICAVNCFKTIRAGINKIDTVFDMLYYAFSVVLMALGIALGLWITSWLAFPIALFICWILSKFGRFKKVESEEEKAEES